MADNVTFQTTVATPPSGAVIATDDVGGAHYQRVKVDLGGDGVSSPWTGNVVDTAAEASLAILDDWDETDRAKVNPIVGQAGVQGGAGASTPLTQRVAIATDANAISAASLPLPTGAATSANQLPDGHNVTVDNASGGAAVNVQDGGNSLTVDGSVSISGAVDTELTTADLDTGAGTDTRAVVGLVGSASGGGALIPGDATNGLFVQARGTAGAAEVGTVADGTAAAPALLTKTFLEIFNGTNYDRVRGDVTNGLDVDVTRLPALVAGTANIGDVDVASIAAGDNNIGNVDVVTMPNVTLAAGTNTNEVVGDVAFNIANSGNPVLVGSSRETMADSAPANRSDTDGDVERFSTADGALFVIPTGAQIFTLHATGVQTGAQIHAAPGAGLSCYITAISFSIGAATASSVKVLNNGGSDFWGPHYLEAINGRGLHVTFPTPLKGTANTRIDVTTTGAATQTVDIQGFIAPG